jgi:hypothetical protein
MSGSGAGSGHRAELANAGAAIALHRLLRFAGRGSRRLPAKERNMNDGPSRPLITPWVILGGGWINLSVTGNGGTLSSTSTEQISPDSAGRFTSFDPVRNAGLVVSGQHDAVAGQPNHIAGMRIGLKEVVHQDHLEHGIHTACGEDLTGRSPITGTSRHTHFVPQEEALAIPNSITSGATNGTRRSMGLMSQQRAD